MENDLWFASSLQIWLKNENTYQRLKNNAVFPSLLKNN